MNYVVGDFETTPEGLLSYGGVKILGDTDRNIFVSLDQMFSYFTEGRYIIYFHNLSRFDGVFILDWLTQNATYVEKFTRKAKEFTTIFTDMGNIVRIKYFVNRNLKFEFRCSKLMWVDSLDNIGKALNLSVRKGRIDYSKITNYNSIFQIPKDFLEYLHNDLDLLEGLVLHLLNNDLTKTLPLTQSSLAIKTLKEFIGEDNYKYYFKNKISTTDWDFIKEAYWGGFSYVNPKFKQYIINKKIYYHDVNSSYSSSMKDSLMPYGYPSKTQPKNTTFTYWEKRYISYCKLKEGCIPYIHSGKSAFKSIEYVVEDTMLVRTYNIDEWEYIESIYEIEYEAIERLYFKTAPIFKEYMEYAKQFKENATNITDRQHAKIMLNATYGKFGQNRVIKSKTWNGENWITKEEVKTKDLSYIPVAAYTTAKSRLLLHYRINEYKEDFIYSDTDSLVLFTKMDDKHLHPTEFGKWDLETYGNKAFFNKAKNYAIVNHKGEHMIKIAGLRTSDNMTFEDYLNNDTYAHLKKKKVINGLKLVSSPFINDIIVKGVINE